MNRRRFWAGRRVLLTGHTGFKGGWLSLWLQQLGAQLHGLGLEPETQPSFFDVCGIGREMHSELGDIRDFGTVLRATERCQPEIVIHMAAQPLVRLSYQIPLETFSTNVMGTAHVLEAARKVSSVKAVVIVTSDKCYQNREWVWGYRENDPMGGHDPYSASKGCAELVTASYRSAFGQAGAGPLIASVRAGNVIGGGDWSRDRIVPDLVRAVESQTPALIRNPHAVRPWQHVLEPLRGYLDVAQALIERGSDCAEGWNFGPAAADARPVGWISDRISALWGVQTATLQETPSQGRAQAPHEAGLLRLDCSKAQAQLGWVPRWSLEMALEKIVAWHRAHQAGDPMRAVSLQQLAQYEPPEWSANEG